MSRTTDHRRMPEVFITPLAQLDSRAELKASSSQPTTLTKVPCLSVHITCVFCARGEGGRGPVFHYITKPRKQLRHWLWHIWPNYSCSLVRIKILSDVCNGMFVVFCLWSVNASHSPYHAYRCSFVAVMSYVSIVCRCAHVTQSNSPQIPNGDK